MVITLVVLIQPGVHSEDSLARLIRQDLFLSAVQLSPSPRLEKAVSTYRLRYDGAVLPTIYLEGYDAFTADRREEAIRAWTKYLEAANRFTVNRNPAQVEEVRGFYEETLSEVWMERESQNPAVDEAIPWGRAASLLPRVKQRPALSRKQKDERQKSHPPSPEEGFPSGKRLLDQGQRAYASGHYERALQLFKLVQQVDPDSQELEEKIEQMEELVQ